MRKHNPWIGALWAVGVALVVVAYSAGIWQSTFFFQPRYVSEPEPVVEILQRLADSLAYPALLVGFGTIGGLLFLHARNHARRKSVG